MASSSLAGEKRRHFKSRPQTMQQTEGGKALHHEYRRREFLHKVRRKGDDRKWDIRGEQILREDFLKYERHWIESQNLSAPAPVIDPEEDDMKVTEAGYDTHVDEMIDRALSQEHDEVDALVSLLEDRNEGPSFNVGMRLDYGSDDENYDSIFMSILSDLPEGDLSTSSAKQISAQANDEAPTGEAMDTTGG
ncbi:MAG: hypothetical protein Q9186_002351 [Xanthomendoza sp. 1 TL-2023]